MDDLNRPGLKEKLVDIFFKLTLPRALLSFFIVILVIFCVTIYENRQELFTKTASIVVVNKANPIPAGDYGLYAPSPEGAALLDAYLKLHPDIVMLSVLDANQVQNRKTVVYRSFNDPAIKLLVEKEALVNPAIGDGALFTTDPDNNIQVLAILNGEFYCTKPGGAIVNAFPDIKSTIAYQCRIPLPPAFGKATGWITLDLKGWPPKDYDHFKTEALLLSLEYYNKEVLKAKQ